VPPKPVDGIPVVPPPQSAPQQLRPTIVQGDVVNSLGNPGSLFPPLISGPGYELAGVAPFGAAAPTLPLGLYATSAVFDSAGALTSFTNGSTTLTLAGRQADFGTLDGVIAWGRWIGQIDLTTGGTTTSVTLSSNDGLHYVVGLPTPAASMPTGVTYTYDLIGGTRPTLANGSIAPGVLNSASLVGDFTANRVTVNLSATAGGSTFTGSATGTIANSTFLALGTAGVSGGGSLGCSGSCTVNVDGFFSGTGATRAGIAYQIGTVILPNFTPSTLSGAAALGR